MSTTEKRAGKRGQNYRARVRMRGHNVSSTFRRKGDAEQWAEDTERAIKLGTYKPPEQVERERREQEAAAWTVGRLITYYEQNHLGGRADADSRRAHLRFWRDELGDLLLADLTQAHVVEARAKLVGVETHQGTKRAETTVNRWADSLRAVVTVGVQDLDLLPANPLRGRLKSFSEKGHERTRTLSPAERKRLLVACREWSAAEKRGGDPRLYDMVVMALGTGARQGEQLALRWPDVDLQRGWATFRNTTTKTKTTRAVPLVGPVLDMLKERKAAHDAEREADNVVRLFGQDGDDPNWVFPHPTGRLEQGKDCPEFPRRPWERALKAARVADFRWHDLRHSSATAMLEAGAGLREVGEILGHSQVQTTARYSHVLDGLKSQTVGRVVAAMFGEGGA